MANHDKAKKHHAKAGQAFARGDMKLAAHHMGHALAALRSTAPMTEPDADEMGGPSDNDADNAVPPQKPSGLRGKLAAMSAKGASGGY